MGCCSDVPANKRTDSKTKYSRDHQFDMYGAIVGKKERIIKELFLSGFDPNYNMPCFNGKTTYHLAAESGDLEIAELLITHSADFDTIDFYGESPLMVACKRGDINMIDYILRKNPILNRVTKFNLRLIDFVNKSNAKEILKLFSY